MTEALVRPERWGDHAAVFELNRRAFDGEVEARLVEGLRREARPLVSLVAELAGRVVGHVLFSPVAVGPAPASPRTMALGPMAVAPEHQRRGIGSRLVRAGLDACRALGSEAVFVLGHREYYPRFGFAPAPPRRLRLGGPELDPYFMALELRPGALDRLRGEVRYHALFDEA